MVELLQKYAGKDASHIFNSTSHSLSFLQMMDTYVVGYYCQPEPELPQIPLDSYSVVSTLLDTTRYLGYLFGLHCHYMRQSLPMQPSEVAMKNWLNAPFLASGLQVSSKFIRMNLIFTLSN